jgi:hypothetical protein
LGWPNVTRTKFQDRQFRRMQRKLRRVIKKRLKPLPLERPILLEAIDTSTTAASSKRNKIFYQQVADMAGQPIGAGRLYTNVTLTGCTGGVVRNCDTANIDFSISSRSGIIYGRCDKCKFTAQTSEVNVTIEGEAHFTDGNWAFRDIKAKGLHFIQTGPLRTSVGDRFDAKTTITGKAWY